jgi:hypothetical protein
MNFKLSAGFSPTLLFAFACRLFASEAGAQELPEAPKVEITIGGEPVSPRIEYAGGEGEHATHLVHLDFALKLQQAGKLDFAAGDRNTGSIALNMLDGAQRIVGVEVSQTFQVGQLKLVNPLASLSDEELRGLWGVKIDQWSDEIARKLNEIDFELACVTVGSDAAIAPDRAVPPLPADVRVLRLESNSNRGRFNNFAALRNLKQLTSLAVKTIGGTFDCRALSESTQLETLDLTGNRLQNADALASLTELKVLKLTYCRGLTDVTFAKAMHDLVDLEVDNTQVEDLSPLDGLESLRTINANATPVRKLPKSLPAIRELTILSTRMSDADVAAFKERHPQRLVRHRWEKSLQEALRTATRLRVRSGGTCHRNIENEETLFETEGREEIKQLLAGIDVEEDGARHCQCCGDPSFEFYDGERLIATLGFHHGHSLRWVNVWPADAMLSQTSSEFLIDWLAKRDVKGPLEAVRAAEESGRAALRRFEQARAGMSPTLADSFQQGPEKFAAQLSKELPDKAAQVQVLLKIFGASNDSWSMLGPIEQFADKQLRTYDENVLAKAAEAALQGDDRQTRRGAARLWRLWRSPLEQWKPANAAELHRIVILVQQEARYYPLRMDAADSLRRWRKELSNEEFDARLAAALCDPAPQVRRKAMLVAGETKHEASIDLLMNVLQGGAVETQPLPEVPEAESIDVPEGFGDVAEGCSDQEVAALALGYMEHSAARPLIEAMAPAPMRDIALALMGDGERLKPEHFAAQARNQELQLAAVEVVVRSKGRHGLKLALDYRQAQAWWEEEHVAERLSQMLRDQEAPGSDMLADCKTLETLKEWYEQNGDAYFKRFESAATDE